MILASLALATITIATDRDVQIEGIKVLGALFPKGTQSTGTLLSAIATSILTITGSVFSIAIVAIQLASGQFGPRMLRDFMQDSVNQLTFGTCSATFVYAIAILWSIEDSKEISFTPQISAFVCLLLAIASTFVLVYFVHHIADSVHADNLVARIGKDAQNSIHRLFSSGHSPKQLVQQVHEVPFDFEQQASIVYADNSGYIHKIQLEKLEKLATRHNLIIKLLYRPGQFIVSNSKLAYVQLKSDLEHKTVHPPMVEIEQISHDINRAFDCGYQRKPEYDVEFPIKQLVEMAIRAISPAVNDPFTAVRCIDRLGVLLCRVLQRENQSPYLFDPAGSLRLIIQPVTFEILVNAAFDQIRQYGKSDVAVIIRMLEAIGIIGEQTRTEKERKVLLRQAEMIHRSSQNPDNVPEENDRKDALEKYNKALSALRLSSTVLAETF